jgi:hypothetical protein
MDMDLESDCCGAAPYEYGEPYYHEDGTISGMCGDCKEHCNFISLEAEAEKEEEAEKLALESLKLAKELTK